MLQRPSSPHSSPLLSPLPSPLSTSSNEETISHSPLLTLAHITTSSPSSLTGGPNWSKNIIQPYTQSQSSKQVIDLLIPRRRCCLQVCHKERRAVMAMKMPKTRAMIVEDDSEEEGWGGDGEGCRRGIFVDLGGLECNSWKARMVLMLDAMDCFFLPLSADFEMCEWCFSENVLTLLITSKRNSVRPVLFICFLFWLVDRKLVEGNLCHIYVPHSCGEREKHLFIKGNLGDAIGWPSGRFLIWYGMDCLSASTLRLVWATCPLPNLD